MTRRRRVVVVAAAGELLLVVVGTYSAFLSRRCCFFFGSVASSRFSSNKRKRKRTRGRGKGKKGFRSHTARAAASLRASCTNSRGVIKVVLSRRAALYRARIFWKYVRWCGYSLLVFSDESAFIISARLGSSETTCLYCWDQPSRDQLTVSPVIVSALLGSGGWRC